MGNIIERKNYKKLNKYYETLEKAKKNLDINERLDNLIEKMFINYPWIEFKKYSKDIDYYEIDYKLYLTLLRKI